jgi:MoaA/NifB/PqqE/SkfB family radical SAM enzyme
MRCNLNCTGCYAGLYSKDGELAETELDGLLCQCETMGAYFVVLSGGEPFLKKHALLRLFERHPAIFFLVFTNGLLLDTATVERLAQLGNVAPALSVEGYENETDTRRGAGVHAKVLNAMGRLRERGVMFGISVTYTCENVDLVTSDEFVRFYGGLGALFGWYFMFMPVGKDPRLDLVPTPEQRVNCGTRIGALRQRHPMFLADFWNDGAAIGGCMAAGRRYLHVLNSGRVEPCVYAHFGVDNIRQTTLLDAANSAFFRAIRREFPYNPSGNLKRPCMIIDNPSVLRSTVRDHVTPAGHPHAEDIVLDPAVRAWVDEYARRLDQLTEADWQRIIADPESRWYRAKDEYRNLFRVHAGERPCEPAAASSSHLQSGSGLNPLRGEQP